MHRLWRVGLLGFASLSVLFFGTTDVGAVDRGERAPELSGVALRGSPVRLREQRGKVVIVDFWASWCEPCAEAMPALERLYDRYGEHGLVVVGVSVDRDARSARRFLRRVDVSFPVMLDRDHEIAEQYEPETMPSTFVVDREGRVRHVHAGFRSGDARRLEQVVRELL